MKTFNEFLDEAMRLNLKDADANHIAAYNNDLINRKFRAPKWRKNPPMLPRSYEKIDIPFSESISDILPEEFKLVPIKPRGMTVKAAPKNFDPCPENQLRLGITSKEPEFVVVYGQSVGPSDDGAEVKGKMYPYVDVFYIFGVLTGSNFTPYWHRVISITPSEYPQPGVTKRIGIFDITDEDHLGKDCWNNSNIDMNVAAMLWSPNDDDEIYIARFPLNYAAGNAVTKNISKRDAAAAEAARKAAEAEAARKAAEEAARKKEEAEKLAKAKKRWTFIKNHLTEYYVNRKIDAKACLKTITDYENEFKQISPANENDLYYLLSAIDRANEQFKEADREINRRFEFALNDNE